jgi:hypothetical protein
MRRFRRLGPIVLAALALQTGLVGSGLACATAMAQMADAENAPGDAAMTAAMPDMPASDSPATTPASSDEPGPRNAPTSPTGCAVTVTCVPAGLLGATCTIATGAVRHADPLVLVVLAPSARNTAPEPPPPRA